MVEFSRWQDWGAWVNSTEEAQKGFPLGWGCSKVGIWKGVGLLTPKSGRTLWQKACRLLVKAAGARVSGLFPE